MRWPLSLWFALLYLGVVAVTVALDKALWGWLAAYLVFSALLYWAFAHDKQAARQGAWRISERSLYVLALCGGWPGALYGQHKLRHKSKKRAFIVLLWVVILTNIAAFMAVAFFALPTAGGEWGIVRRLLGVLKGVLLRL